MIFSGGKIPFILLLLFIVSLLACAQPRSSVSASASPSQDANLDVKSDAGASTGSQTELVTVAYDYAGKHGPSKFAQIDIMQVKEARALPTGYMLFKNRACRVDTEAIVLGQFYVAFKVLDAETPTDFNRLRILHLEIDELSPTGWSWADCTTLTDKHEGGNDDVTSKDKPERRLPDFAGRKISCVTSELGIFVIASKEKSPAKDKHQFTRIDVSTVSSPGVLLVGENVTYTITITNKGPIAAGEINLENWLETGLVFISATPSQGTCLRSTFSTGGTICHLGVLPTGATATISIIALFERNVTSPGRGVQNSTPLVFKERPNDFRNAVNGVQTAIATPIRL